MLSTNPEQESSDKPPEVVVRGLSAKIGDTVLFEVLKTDKSHELIKVVLGATEQRQLLKFVGDDRRLYTILPAVSIWQGEIKSKAIAVAYSEEPPRLLFLGPSQHNMYRSYGIAAERTVVDVQVASALEPQPDTV